MMSLAFTSKKCNEKKLFIENLTYFGVKNDIENI